MSPRATIPTMRGKVALAGLPLALAVGCGSGGGHKQTVSAPSSAANTTVLDAQARLACSRVDDALAGYYENPNGLGAAAVGADGLVPALEAAKATANTDIRAKAAALTVGYHGLSDPLDVATYLYPHFPANADTVRDACIRAGWQSTTHG